MVKREVSIPIGVGKWEIMGIDTPIGRYGYLNESVYHERICVCEGWMISNGAAPCDHSASICPRSQQVRYVISLWYRQIPFRVYVGWYRIYLPLSKFQKLLYPGRAWFRTLTFKSMWRSNSLWHVAPARKPSFLFSLEASMDNESWFDPCQSQAFNQQNDIKMSYSVIFSVFHSELLSWMSIFPHGDILPPPKLQAATGLRNRIHWSRRRHAIRTSRDSTKNMFQKKWEMKSWKRRYVTSRDGGRDGLVVVLFRLPKDIFWDVVVPPPKKWWSWQHLFRFKTEISVEKCMKHTGYKNDHTLSEKRSMNPLWGFTHT